MKKFIVIGLALILAVSASFAQSVVQLTPIVGDVLINTATLNKPITPSGSITTGISGLAIGFTIVVNTGTGAGTAQLQVSYDNVNWINLGAAYTITNATQSSQFTIAAPVQPYVRVQYVGAGTENITIKTFYRAPRYQTP